MDKLGEYDGRIDIVGNPLGAMDVVGTSVGPKEGINEGTTVGDGDHVGEKVGAVGKDVGGLEPGSNKVGVNVTLVPCPAAV